MKLIILNSVTNDKPDAFIRLEKCNLLTIGFPKTDGKFMWLIDEKTGNFTNCHHYLHWETALKSAGIFKINETSAQLCWYFGDKENVETRFKNLTGLQIFCEEATPQPQEIEVIPEITANDPEPLTIAKTENPPDNFWDCNKESFMEILNNNPENLTLSALIPGSVWVDITDENYIFGIIYDENNFPMYLCYGFSLPWSETPPENLEGYCQWIPLDFLAPHDEGFWVIYINAKTGERVR